jgi:hypothetical protein
MILKVEKEVLGQQAVRESQSTTNTTCMSLVMNPVLRSKSPTVNCPHHVTVLNCSELQFYYVVF